MDKEQLADPAWKIWVGQQQTNIFLRLAPVQQNLKKFNISFRKLTLVTPAMKSLMWPRTSVPAQYTPVLRACGRHTPTRWTNWRRGSPVWHSPGTGTRTMYQRGWLTHYHLKVLGAVRAMTKLEPHHEKTCLRGFRPGKTQTGLLRYRDKLKSWNFGFSKYRYYTT